MCALEFPLLDQLDRELRQWGLHAEIVLQAAEGDGWRLGVTAASRRFELGFGPAEGFWAREVTPGRERHLLSNDHPRVHTVPEAGRLAARLLAATLLDPAFPPRDPPVV